MDLPQKTNAIQQKLKDIGIKNVYFEPPQSTRMEYPCVVFHRGTMYSRTGDNLIYHMFDAYDLTYISREPDDNMVHVIIKGDLEHEQPFRMIRHVRHFTSDGLHHDQFKLYF